MSNTMIRVESPQKKLNLRRLFLLSSIAIFVLITTTSCKDDFARAANAFLIVPTQVPASPTNQTFVMRDGEKILHNYTVQLMYQNDSKLESRISDVQGQVIFMVPTNRRNQAASITLLDNMGQKICHWHVIVGAETPQLLNMSTTALDIVEPNETDTGQTEEAELVKPGTAGSIAPPTPMPSFQERFDPNYTQWVSSSMQNSTHSIETAVINGQLQYSVTFAGTNRSIALAAIPYQASPQNYKFSLESAVQIPSMQGSTAISLIFGQATTDNSFYAARFYPQKFEYTLSRYENGTRRLADVQSGVIPDAIFNRGTGATNRYEIEVYERIVIIRINGHEIGRTEVPSHPEEHRFAISVDGEPSESTELIFDNISIIPINP